MKKISVNFYYHKRLHCFTKLNGFVISAIFCLSFTNVNGQQEFHLPPGVKDLTTDLVQKKAGWTFLNNMESIDGFTRIDNSIFGGNIGCDIGPLKDIDVKTFQVFPGSSYAKDKRNLYYPIQTNCVDYDSCGVCYFFQVKVKGAHPSTFEYLGKDYANDGRKVFWRGLEIVGADASTFKVIEGPEAFYFSIDKNYVYRGGKIFKGADPKTFYYDKSDPRNVIDEWSATFIIRDKNHKWEYVAGGYPTEIDNR